MDYSIFSHKFFGYFFFLLLSKEGKEALSKMVFQPSFTLSSGFMTLMVDLSFIILHNLWIFVVLRLVTLMGWFSSLCLYNDYWHYFRKLTAAIFS